MKYKRYRKFFEKQEDDKYYDVTIDNPDTGNTIKLMTALSYPEDSKLYKKAVEIKKYLDDNEGKGLDVKDEDISKDEASEIEGLTKDKKEGEPYKASELLSKAMDDIFNSPIDNDKKKVLQDKIKKAEEIRKKLTMHSQKLNKALNDISKEVELAKKTTGEGNDTDKSRIKALEDQKEKINELSDKIKDKLDAIETKIQDFSRSVVVIGNKEQK